MPATDQAGRRVRRAMLGLAFMLAAGAAAQESGQPVVVARSELREVIEQVPISGTVSSPRVAQLSSAVAGRVEAVLVDAGDRVGAGDVLLRLDEALARLALDAARAASAQAREELADARRRLADVERLARRSSIAETELRARESEVRLDAATLALREAERRSEAERLERHALKAPFAGVIGRKLTEAGEWVAPGEAVLELFADEGLRIDFRVAQDFFPRVGPDTPVEVQLDALGGRRLRARIGRIVPVSDPSARTFLIHVYPQEQGLPLTPGMSASGVLALHTGERSVVVSRDALLRHPDGRVTAWVVEGEGSSATVAERQLITGRSFDGQVVVRSGLDAGLPVVVEGNEALRQGQQVLIRARR